jgi:hypothetical protein
VRLQYGATPAPRRRPAFLGDMREGDRRPVARGSGKWPVRTPSRCGGWRAARSAARPADAQRAGGALECGQAVFQPVNASLTAFFSKKLNGSAQSGE